MENLEKYLSILENDQQGLLLTSRYSRYYSARYDIAEAVAVVSKAGCRYFTDSRYIEAAQNGIHNFEILEMNRENPFCKLSGAAQTGYAALCGKACRTSARGRRG